MLNPGKSLEKQILATIVYYDILDYPLTSFEIFLYLVSENDVNASADIGAGQCLVSEDNNINNGGGEEGNRQNNLSEIIKLLSASEYLRKHLDQKFGFYFLKGREETVQQRLDRKKIADRKWKKIRKIFLILQIVPFVRMILVSGSLSLGNSREESDIDLIITAKKGRIWTVRTFVTLLTAVLGVRRHKNKTENKICLNHYITDKSLRIPFESLYNAQSYIHLLNVYNDRKDNELFEKFQEENGWIKKYAENFEISELASLRSIKRYKILGFISGAFESVFGGKAGDYLENKFSEIEGERIKKDPLRQKKGGRITINDEQLEFHPDSHEGHIIPEFNGRMEKLGLFEFANQKDSGLNC